MVSQVDLQVTLEVIGNDTATAWPSQSHRLNDGGVSPNYRPRPGAVPTAVIEEITTLPPRSQPSLRLHFAFTPFAPALTRRRTPRVHTAAELAIVATIVQFVFPPGTGPRGWALWGTDFNQWSSLQYGLICDFWFVSMIHVMLHWSWVCTIVARRLLKQTEIPDDGIQTILGAGLLIGLLRLVHSLSERP